MAANRIKRPLCEEGKNAFYRIVRADPVVYATLKKVCVQAYIESFIIDAAVLLSGLFISFFFCKTEHSYYWYLIPAAAVILVVMFNIVSSKRERSFSRCLADINQTLREDVIVQVHSNPVGGMYENDSYSILKEKGIETDSFCDNLSSVSKGAVKIILSLTSAICMLAVSPISAVPSLLLCFFRARRLHKLRNRYDDAQIELDEELEKYDQTCENLLNNADSIEPDDISLSRAKAATAVDEAEAKCVNVRYRILSVSRIVGSLIIMFSGVLCIMLSFLKLSLWQSSFTVISSLLLLGVIVVNTSEYYSFVRSLADAEWDAINLTTVDTDKEEQNG